MTRLLWPILSHIFKPPGSEVTVSVTDQVIEYAYLFSHFCICSHVICIRVGLRLAFSSVIC